MIRKTDSAHAIMVVIAPWTEPLLAYLLQKELPDNQANSRRIVGQSKAYKVHEGELYKMSTTGVLQRCISEEEGKLVLREIHSGMSGHHAARPWLARPFEPVSTGQRQVPMPRH